MLNIIKLTSKKNFYGIYYSITKHKGENMKIFAIGVQNTYNTNNSRHLNFSSLAQIENQVIDTFNKAKKSNFAIKELSKEEFKVLKDKIIHSIDTFPSFREIEARNINQWNVQLFDYMLQHPKEYKSKHFQIADSIAGLYKSGNNKSSAEVILKMLKMPWLFKYGFCMEYDIWKIGGGARNAKAADIKTAMLDLLEKNKTDYTDRQLVYIGHMLSHFNSDIGLNFAKKLIEKPDILNAPLIKEDFFDYFEDDKSRADVRSSVLDKINSKPELLKDENFMDCVHGFLSNVGDEKGKEFAFKILDNPILFKSESFTKSLNNLLYYYPTYNSVQAKNVRGIMNKIVDATVAKPDLFKNDKFLKVFGDLLFVHKEGNWIKDDAYAIEIGEKNLFLIKHGYYDAK